MLTGLAALVLESETNCIKVPKGELAKFILQSQYAENPQSYVLEMLSSFVEII